MSSRSSDSRLSSSNGWSISLESAGRLSDRLKTGNGSFSIASGGSGTDKKSSTTFQLKFGVSIGEDDHSSLQGSNMLCPRYTDIELV
eukprot:scaffold170243_cov42-Prasinocladus_malaysianus.AAC.2